MFSLVNCALKVLKASEVHVFCTREFYRSVPLLSKQSVKKTWAKNTEKFLKKTEKILSGDSAKNKYVTKFRGRWWRSSPPNLLTLTLTLTYP